MAKEQLVSIAPSVVEAILPVLERHSDDGLVFVTMVRPLVSLLRRSKVKLEPQVRQGLSNCAIAGISSHSQYENAQVLGQALLKTAKGNKEANEVLSHYSTDGPFVSEEVSGTIFASILALRDSHLTADFALTTIESLFGLIQQDDNQNDIFYGLLDSMNTVETILGAIKLVSAVSSRFLHRAAGVLFFLLQDSRDRSLLFLNLGGFPQCVEIGMAETTQAYVSISFMGIVTALIDGLGEECIPAIGLQAFVMALQCMVLHKQDPKVYSNSCLLMGITLGPHLEDQDRIVTCGVQLVYDGILMHQFHEEAQQHGREVLEALVGSEAAKDMIEHAEMHHREECTCSSAA